jgi:hypothetical protein
VKELKLNKRSWEGWLAPGAPGKTG